jgi:hypothetical protein
MSSYPCDAPSGSSLRPQEPATNIRDVNTATNKQAMKYCPAGTDDGVGSIAFVAGRTVLGNETIWTL